MTSENYEDLTQYLRIFNELLRDLEDKNMMSKMIELESR